MKNKKKIKRILFTLLLASSICITLPLSVSAMTNTSEASYSESSPHVLTSESVKYLENGLSITTQIYESSVDTRATTYTKEGSKSITCKDDSGNALWKYTVSGKFTVVSGTSATCTVGYGTPYIYNSNWSTYSNNISKSGNKAIGTIRMQKHWLGLVVQDLTETVTLTCSVNGVLS